MQAQQIDLALETATKISAVGAEMKMKFVKRDDTIDLAVPTIVSGNHFLMLGTPGVTKSGIAAAFAKGMGVSYFRYLLGVDTGYDHLFGHISVKKLQEDDEFSTRWAGLANCKIAFLDEVGKAPNSVQNYLLSAMNERMVFDLYNPQRIPLHTVFSASNELFGDENPAIWDRFLVRQPVRDNLTDDELWSVMTGDIDNITCRHINPEGLTLCRQLCDTMRQTAIKNTMVRDTVMSIRAKIAPILGDTLTSSRRWKESLLIAAGSALSRGVTQIEPQDLVTFAGTLWDQPEHYDPIREIVIDVCDLEIKLAAAFKAEIAKLKLDLSRLKPHENSKISPLLDRASLLYMDNLKKASLPKWSPLVEELRQLLNTYTGN